MVTTRRGRGRSPVRFDVFQSSIATTSVRGRGRYQISSNANASEPNLNPCARRGRGRSPVRLDVFQSSIATTSGRGRGRDRYQISSSDESSSSSLGAGSSTGDGSSDGSSAGSGGQSGGDTSGGGPNSDPDSDPDPDSDTEYVPSQPSDDGSPSDPNSPQHNPPAEHVAVNDYVSIGSWKYMKDYFKFRDANERMQTRMAALVQEWDDLLYFSRIGNEHQQFYFDSFFHQDYIRIFDSSDVDQVRKVVQMGYRGRLGKLFRWDTEAFLLLSKIRRS